MNARILGTIGLGLATTVALTACGGGSTTAATTPSQTPSATATPLSTADWASQGNAICTASHDQEKALLQPSTAAELNTYLLSSVQIVTGAITKISALNPPAEYAADVATFIAHGRAEVAAVIAAAAQAKAGDVQGAIAAMEKVAAADKADNALARRIGLTACATN